VFFKKVSRSFYSSVISNDTLYLSVKLQIDSDVQGEEEKDIRDRIRFQTLKLMPEVISGKGFTDKSGMTIWACDDNNKVPIQIDSPLSVSYAKAILTDYQYLCYLMQSKIK
jgi:hypothetical protein